MSHNKNQRKEYCPLCGQHCSFKSLGCRKGEKYFRNLQKQNSAEQRPIPELKTISLDDTIIIQLRLCSQYLHRESRDGESRFRILSILLDHEKISQRELKEMLGIKSGSLSELLTKLEKKGLLQRQKNVADKRNRDIILTDAGHIWLNNHTSKRQCKNQLLAGLSAEDKSQLSVLLDNMLKGQNQSDDLISPSDVQLAETAQADGTLNSDVQETEKSASISGDTEADVEDEAQRKASTNDDVQGTSITSESKTNTELTE
jgi:DNA-binding MarR family transcriptional regulator